ncbi:hypothetical protein JIN85_09075 [Luteolibacter pohnpeiensis]|uniref:Tetratricopeptide repeat protein n=1 Tax=Luteolibacter pohnpeiensis TaxID=454153 RepID=A0A934SAC8_9BACT|nr:hypothetical protein [Luteolibacter pohnpeiensis]MBK1882567.1 hypothetical protein [Luteolibacter pohnpeiensis]
MEVANVLTAATGWIDLGLADEALVEIESLSKKDQSQSGVLELKLYAEMECQFWNAAADTAKRLCLRDPKDPSYFIHAAFCIHETGDTHAACQWLLKGPRSLFKIAIFHYNLACYLWVLGEKKRARSHLQRAIKMDGDLEQAAREDRDLKGIDI